MPNVTVTIRGLKNVVTGLDLSIPNYKERPGRLQNTLECNVVAVSNLACFKTPQHKQTDIVQFTVRREFEEFEAFRRSLLLAYPGTVLPELPRSVFTFVGASITQQVRTLEKFLKQIAAISKLATAVETVQFLGFSALSARKLHQRKDIFEELEGPDHRTDDLPDLFQDNGEEEDEELFRPALVSPSRNTQPTAGSSQLFESLDYGGQVSRDDELVMVAGATDPDYHRSTGFNVDPEEEELLTVEDDIEELRLKARSKGDRSPDKRPTKSASKPEPSPKPKPELARKPHIPSKPGGGKGAPPKPSTKPAVPSKTGSKPDRSQLEIHKNTAPSFQDTQEDIFAESSRGKMAASQAGLFDLNEGDSVQSLDADDIMKYIEVNAKHDDDDLDLFS